MLEACKKATQAVMKDADVYIGDHELNLKTALDEHSGLLQEEHPPEVQAPIVCPDYHFYAANVRAECHPTHAIPPAEHVDIEYPRELSHLLQLDPFNINSDAQAHCG